MSGAAMARERRRMMMMRRRDALLAGAGGVAWLRGPGALAADEPVWPTIRSSLFGGRPIVEGDGVIRLVAPPRAHDAAVVPMTVAAIPPGEASPVRSVWLVIDKNPAPLAGVFHFGRDAAPVRLETRVRVNEYTPLHAVAETEDGRLFAVESFVKAAGGCSAPGRKDPVEAEARRGKMKLKALTPFMPGAPMKVQLLISHPNYTGLQIDQVTRNWIPPDYVQKIQVAFAGRSVLEVASDISLSEDPSLTFVFTPEAPGALEVTVEDSAGRHFDQSWPLGQSS
jgi:sulfur-oxidizing protein SoxY